MPTPNEIAAAAERLRRVKAGESKMDVYRHIYEGNIFRTHIFERTPRVIAAWDTDKNTIIDAYLAEHAAEPVTRDWLVGVLGEPDIEQEGSSKAAHWVSYVGSLWFYGTCNMCELFTDEGHPITDVETRGDVLAFLRLVRWPDNQERGASRGE